MKKMDTQQGNMMQCSDYNDRDLNRGLWPEMGLNQYGRDQEVFLEK